MPYYDGDQNFSLKLTFKIWSKIFFDQKIKSLIKKSTILLELFHWKLCKKIQIDFICLFFSSIFSLPLQLEQKSWLVCWEHLTRTSFSTVSLWRWIWNLWLAYRFIVLPFFKWTLWLLFSLFRNVRTYP